MAIDARLENLDQRHRQLEDALATEMRHASADEVKINELKRRKLRIRDEMAELARQTRPPAH